MTFALIHLPWTCPIVFHLAGQIVPVHLVFDLLAYSGGFQIYRFQRRKYPNPLDSESQAWVFLGCLVGALLGAKFLAWAEHFHYYWAIRNEANVWLGGKTIIGGLLGGWAGIEIAKKSCQIRSSTGDAFVIPLIFGMSVGRIGCFLTGLSDLTCGSPTSLPWAVDFGDGIGRHPAQLYEIVFLVLFGASLPLWKNRLKSSGSLFRIFLISYLTFRFFSEFYKPRALDGGLYFYFSPLQWACFGGVFLATCSLAKCLTAPTSTTN